MARCDALNPGLYRLHRVFYIAIGAGAVVMLAIGPMMLILNQPDSGIGLVGLFILPLGALHWFAANGARDGRTSGRVLSRVIGTVSLLRFSGGNRARDICLGQDIQRPLAER